MAAVRSLALGLSGLLLILATAVPTATAAPSPVEVYSCFNGGTTVVVFGDPVVTCLQAVDIEKCPWGDVAITVAGVPVRECEWGPPPP